MLIESLHWSLVTFGLLPLAIGALSAGGTASIGRTAFLFRILVILGALSLVAFGGLLFLMFRSEELEQQLPAASLYMLFIAIGVLALIVQPFLLGRWTSLRLNHLGWSRWLVFLFFVPLANVVFLIALCFTPGKATDTAIA